MILLAFPCDINIARLFCQKINLVDPIAIILQKQEELFKELLNSSGVGKIIVLNENIYGRISSDKTKKILNEIKELNLEHIYFPINDFCGNVALFLSIFSDNVSAINATSDFPVKLDLQKKKLNFSDFDGFNNKRAMKSIQSRIVNRLNKMATFIEELFLGDNLGERPTIGLASGMPYDFEVLFRYLYASEKTIGSVLEIGCGFGYGAFSIAKLNPDVEIIAIDYDSKAIKIANKLWGNNKRINFEVSQAEKLPFEDNSFDSVVCYEVIEHVDNPESLLSEIHRVLKADGKLIGSTPNYKLYPFKANMNRVEKRTPEELRSQGIWPWHIQEFDEESIEQLLTTKGFRMDRFRYPTFVKGISILNDMKHLDFGKKLEFLSKNLKWSVTDFLALDEYYPIFSGCSFIFEAYKE